MLPINIDTKKYKQKKEEQIQQDYKKKSLASNQQALANILVRGSLPTNPNTQQIQQAPASN